MKFKVTSDSAGRILALECDKDAEFAYADAERVQRGDLDSFLPFACWKGGKSYEIAYRIGSYPSLKQVLSSPVDSSYLYAILGSLLHMMRQCEQNGLSRLRVVFDLAYVFFDLEAAALRFAYVPMRSYASPSGEFDLLVRLCQAASVAPQDQPFILAIWDYACRTSIMTSVGFARFLSEWGFWESDGSRRRRHREKAVGVSGARADYGWDFVSFAERERVAEAERQTAGFSGAEGGCTLAPDAAMCAPVRIMRLSDGTCYELAEGAYVVGRASDCSISLPDVKSVSRRHAELSVRGESLVVRDLGSTNGVYVDGSRISPGADCQVPSGGRIAFGDEEFQFG